MGHTNQFLAGPSHALLWQGTANSLIDLHPAGWDASYAMATDGVRQVGWRERHTGQTGQFATMWSGSAKGWVDLHDPTYSETNALGISGDEQVGYGFLQGGGTRAVLWHNTASSIVSLHPVGADFSWANGTDGTQQVGHAGTGAAGSRAALWTGTAKTHVNLHPAGYEVSEAYGVAEGQQVGFASLSGQGRAVLWLGSSSLFIDLNPQVSNLWGSSAYATNGFTQVGFAGGPETGFQVQAALWEGSRESYMNLHASLAPEYSGVGARSEATGIDEFGNIVGWARHVPTGAAHAILWKPVPEPSSLVAIGLFALFAIIRRRFGFRVE